MNLCNCPSGMTRRHFLSHLAGAAAMASPAIAFTNSILAKSLDLKKQHKSCILLWMGGGPSTIDIWDLKPGAANRRIVQANFDQRRRSADHGTPAAVGQANGSTGGDSLDEHPRSRSRPRPILHAHRLRAQSEYRASQLRGGHRARTGRQSARAGTAAVCLRRRSKRRTGILGHDLGAVCGEQQRRSGRRNRSRQGSDAA